MLPLIIVLIVTHDRNPRPRMQKKALCTPRWASFNNAPMDMTQDDESARFASDFGVRRAGVGGIIAFNVVISVGDPLYVRPLEFLKYRFSGGFPGRQCLELGLACITA